MQENTDILYLCKTVLRKRPKLIQNLMGGTFKVIQKILIGLCG